MNRYLALLLLSLGWACRAQALDIYLVRHAETMGNVTGDYSEENQRTFSPKGLEQIQRLTDKLTNYHFDAILVSPAWRTQKTILPYLKASRQKAVMFPEIIECDCGITGEETPAADPARGAPVDIIEEGREWLELDPELSATQYALNDKNEGLAILRRAIDLLRARYDRSPANILLVSHSCTGGRLIELLLGKPPRGSVSPGNTAVCHLRQMADGSFELLTFNDKPLSPFRRALMFGFQPDMLPGFLDLAGTWKIAGGDDAARAAPDFEDSDFLSTQVPGGWEANALPDYDGLAWYRLRFNAPKDRIAAWGVTNLVLFMGAIDDADETYLNGRLIGSSGQFSPAKVTAWDQPRIYPIASEDLLPENVLAVRVDDWGGGGGIWRGPVAIGPAETLNRLITPQQDGNAP